MTSTINVAIGSALVINGAGDANVAWSIEGLADGAGRISDQIDLGAAPRPFQFRWDAKIPWQSTPTQYGTFDIYLAESPDAYSSTLISGDVGLVDAALGDIDQAKNLTLLGTVIAEDAATTDMISDGVFETTARYINIVGVNNAGASTNATSSSLVFVLTPTPSQGQDT